MITGVGGAPLYDALRPVLTLRERRCLRTVSADRHLTPTPPAGARVVVEVSHAICPGTAALAPPNINSMFCNFISPSILKIKLSDHSIEMRAIGFQGFVNDKKQGWQVRTTVEIIDRTRGAGIDRGARA